MLRRTGDIVEVKRRRSVTEQMTLIRGILDMLGKSCECCGHVYNQSDVARHFGVNAAYVSRVIRGPK